MKGNGSGFNFAQSKSVGRVDSKIRTDDLHKLPNYGQPNSVVQNYREGKLSSERYYNKYGDPYLDIDYDDHGNPKMHPTVPHEHRIEIVDGKIKRYGDEGIKK